MGLDASDTGMAALCARATSSDVPVATKPPVLCRPVALHADQAACPEKSSAHFSTGFMSWLADVAGTKPELLEIEQPCVATARRPEAPKRRALLLLVMLHVMHCFVTLCVPALGQMVILDPSVYIQ